MTHFAFFSDICALDEVTLSVDGDDGLDKRYCVLCLSNASIILLQINSIANITKILCENSSERLSYIYMNC